MVPSKIGGWVPDPPGKDWGFREGLLPRLPQATGDVDLEPWCTVVSDQLHLSSCVGNSTADAYELCSGLAMAQQEARSRGLGDAVAAGLTLADIGRHPEQISRLQIYFNGRSRMRKDGHEKLVDDGMYIRAAFDAVRILGVCPERMWPYEPANVNRLPPVDSIWYSLKHRIDSFYRIPDGGGDQAVESVLQAVRGYHPVVFSVPVTEAFASHSGPSVIPAPKRGDAVRGYHAIMLVGCRGDALKMRNSWGAGWGAGGYALLAPEWFTEGHASSLFVPTLGVSFS